MSVPHPTPLHAATGSAMEMQLKSKKYVCVCVNAGNQKSNGNAAGNRRRQQQAAGNRRHRAGRQAGSK